MGTTVQRLVGLFALVGLVLAAQPAPDPARAAERLVISAADSGPGTLRAALAAATSGDSIRFSPALFPPTAPAVIQLTAPLAPITVANLLIDASDSGVVLEGWLTPPGSPGLVIRASGVRVQGLSVIGFKASGIIVEAAATDVVIGGDRGVGAGPNGQGNRLAANTGDGLEIRGAGTSGTRVTGNWIGLGPNGVTGEGNANNGLAIWQGAAGTIVGGGVPGLRNVIGGNAYDGLRIAGSGTTNNQVLGNFLGTNAAGSAAVPNGLHGVELADNAGGNSVGGLSAGQGNLIAGSRNHGVVITSGASGNSVLGNTIGPVNSDASFNGTHENGGMDIADGASNNLVQGNLIHNNPKDGIALFANGSTPSSGNRIIANQILRNGDASPSSGPGISIGANTSDTEVTSNLIAENTREGIWLGPCSGNRLSANSIYGNNRLGGGSGIRSNCVAAPTIAVTSLGAPETAAGTAPPGARVEVFADDDSQGRVYEGFATADGAGRFTFTPPDGSFSGTNLTATATLPAGGTSPFSPHAPFHWTVLLYLNGDNDLEAALFEALDALAAAGSPRANLVALVDGYTAPGRSGSEVYELTHGQLIRRTAAFTSSAELNMGDGRTLSSFVSWARGAYPARNLALSLVDHGGGWAPGGTEELKDGLPRGSPAWLAGTSGLSWDFSSNHDYLGSVEIREALLRVTNNGAQPLDLLIYDVCLMGMVEVAYQIRDVTRYFFSSQNIGWAPVGSDNRYVRLLGGLPPTATAEQMAVDFVSAYDSSLPDVGHPLSVAAVDTAGLSALIASIGSLSTALRATLVDDSSAQTLAQIYRATQKVDYDTDLQIEPERDGFVDLYDLADRLGGHPAPTVAAAAATVKQAHAAAVIAERHSSGYPWPFPERTWNLEGLHGLSLFLPLGEDPALPLPPAAGGIGPTSSETIKLRSVYSANQLDFVRDTGWDAMIDSYYASLGVTLPEAVADGPVAGLQPVNLTWLTYLPVARR